MLVPRGLKWPILLLMLALALAGAACTGGGPGSTATSAVPTPTQQAPVPTSTVTPSTATPEATGDFFLTIEEPSEPESIIAEASITVVGRTRLDATVSVNDVFANVDEDGRFRVGVDLELGPNIVEVVASLDSGEMLDQVLVIIYSP